MVSAGQSETLQGGLKRRGVFQGQPGEHASGEFKVGRVRSGRHLTDDGLSLLQSGLGRLPLSPGQVQQGRPVGGGLGRVSRQGFETINNGGGRDFLFFQLYGQFRQQGLQRQLLLHLRMPLRIKLAVGNHNSYWRGFTTAAAAIKRREFGKQLIAGTQRVRHQIPLPLCGYSAALGTGHDFRLQRQRDPVVAVDRDLLFQTDQRQVVFRHRTQLQNVVGWQQQCRLLLIHKAGSWNQVWLRTNFVTWAELILKARLLRNQVHPIGTRLLHRHVGRPELRRWLGRAGCRVLPGLTHERDHHDLFGTQWIEAEIGGGNGLVRLNRQVRGRSLKRLQVAVLSRSGHRRQLTVFGKFQAFCKLLHSRSWPSLNSVPFCDRVASQNAIIHIAAVQPHIGRESCCILKLHLVLHQSSDGRPGLQHRAAHPAAGRLHDHGHRFLFGKQQRMWCRLKNLHLHPRNACQIGHRQHAANRQLPESGVRGRQQPQKDGPDDTRCHRPSSDQAEG